MRIESGSGNDEVRNSEVSQSNNENIEQRQAEHQRNGEELEGNSTIDHEGERRQLDGKEVDKGEDLELNVSDPLDLDDTIEDDKAYESENPEMASKVKEITKPYYTQAGELARSNDGGRTFTDHKEEHVEMVADKSLEAADAIKKATEKGGLKSDAKEGKVGFSSDIDKKTLEGAALSHDTGMKGDGYALVPIMGENGQQKKDSNGKKIYEKDSDGKYVVRHENNSDFNEVRNNHSLNSAINLLENREKYKEAGYDDEQIDKIAVECMAHSKSSSGVSDLNNKADWSDCFDRIDATVDMYNKEHPDKTISFDRTRFERNDDKLSSLATETLALRIGDVSRDSGPYAEAQSGEVVYVDRSTIDNGAGSEKGEVKNANITIGDKGEQIENDYSKQVHAGEQNIVENHTYVGDDGKVVHEITVSDGSSAPRCTQKAIEDHIGELRSASEGKFVVVVKFDKPCDTTSAEYYEKFRDNMANISNIDIEYKNMEE
ncbi:MAG: hypothetical protein K6G26_04735 [Lachnospiraceae bacterium]|nr:hypothetical protein [Lachnospiraceae bacterium]